MAFFSNIIITIIETGKLSTWQICTVVEIVRECVAHVMLRVLCLLRVLHVLCALRLYVLCALCVSCVLCVLCACFVKQEVAGAKTLKTKGKVRAKIHLRAIEKRRVERDVLACYREGKS